MNSSPSHDASPQPASEGSSNAAEQRQIQIIPIPGIPLVQPGDDVAALVVEAAEAADVHLRTGDILVVAQRL